MTLGDQSRRIAFILIFLIKGLFKKNGRIFLNHQDNELRDIYINKTLSLMAWLIVIIYYMDYSTTLTCAHTYSLTCDDRHWHEFIYTLTEHTCMLHLKFMIDLERY